MRSPTSPRARRGGSLPALALAALILPPLARADFAIVPIHELIGSSSIVAIGTVISVEPAKFPPGSFLMHVDVEETILGVEVDRLLLPASNFDPLLPAVQDVGMKLLVFVPDGNATITEANVIPLVHPPEPVLELVRTVAESGAQLLLPAVQKFLVLGSGVPPELLGSLLQTLREAGAGGGPHVSVLLQMACTSAEMYRMEAQLFAIGELGDHGVKDASDCLQTTALQSENLARRIAAVEALGNLRDPDAVEPLLTLIPPLPPGTIAGLRGDEDFATPSADDPEDESNISRDPDEGREADGGAEDEDGVEVIPGDEADGERELDFAPSDDAMISRDEAGLIDAAVLALGKIGSTKAVPDLFKLAREGDDLALHSSVVVALGLIGGNEVRGPLSSISKTHPNELVRALASQTLARLFQSGRR